MKIVIDISKQRYHSLQECAVAVTDEIHKAVLNGKPYEERKRGKWILKGLRGEKCVCGLCGSDDKYNLLKYNYCPNCGAKMEGGEADAE